MAEKTTGLARASCSTKDHIRAIDGSVPVGKYQIFMLLLAGLRWMK